MIVTTATVEIFRDRSSSGECGGDRRFIAQDESSPMVRTGNVRARRLRRSVDRLFRRKWPAGKARRSSSTLSGRGSAARRRICGGIGKTEKVPAETIRRSAGAVLGVAKHKIDRAAILLPEVKGISLRCGGGCNRHGGFPGGFDYREYKGAAPKPEKEEKPINRLAGCDRRRSGVKAAVERAKIVCTGQNFAADDRVASGEQYQSTVAGEGRRRWLARRG